MSHEIAKKVRSWDRQYSPPAEEVLDLATATDEAVEAALESAEKNYQAKYARIYSQINFLAIKLFKEFEITKHPPYLDFEYRLDDWLDCAPDVEQQKLLFELVPRLFFIGSEEYSSLYKTAFNGPIARWLIEQVGLTFDQRDVEEKLRQAIKTTWFCAITDSMQIARFYHVNHVTGIDLRPDLRVLMRFGDAQEIMTFMDGQSPQLERIVLLEDFVGTGSQMEPVVKFAATLPNHCQVLLCPLVICPSGDKLAQRLACDYKDRLKFEPALRLDDSVILKKTKQPNEENYITELRKLVINLYPKVKGSKTHQLYGPFGFGERVENGGLLVVLHTNCPDNTIPLVHHESDGPWHPIFPRSSRL